MTGQTILIIDDSAEIRALLESVLRFAGHGTLSAGTGEQALSLAFAARPDVLLVDLELPDISGLNILEQLHRANLAIPSVIMTGYGSEGLAARALQLGALGYLIKPFTTEEVLATVEQALAVGQLARDRESLSALASRHARHLQVLSMVGQAVANGLECDALLQRIVEAALYVTRAERAWLGLRQGQRDRFRVVAHYGVAGCSRQEFEAASGAEIVRAVLAQGTLLRARAEPGATIRLQTGDEVTALLQVPLGPPRATVGLLSVDRQASDVPFSEQDEQLLLILASFALLALDRDRQVGQGAGALQ